MGFTNVVWESRSTEQLARDLTEGPGPSSVGEAGAAWIRVANEFAKVSADYDRLLESFRASWESTTSDAVVRKLEAFGKWLQAASLSAAANGRRAEEAAVANTVAILSMPTVSEAIEAKAAQDMMASLSAYNGAILHGSFAEFDDAASAQQADAAAVMNRYEEACAELAEPWEQPVPPQVVNGGALKAEKEGKGGGSRGGGGGGGAAPRQLSPMLASPVGLSKEPQQLRKASFTSDSSSGSGMGRGGGYAPMAGTRRDGSNHTYESFREPGTLEGAGEAGASLSDGGQSWLPAAQQNDAPFTVSHVSWGPNTAIFDDLAAPEPEHVEGFAEEPERTLQQVSDRWVSPPVIGAEEVSL
ncbi:PPE domain-containing protein [Mycobacterium vicinigordonae]|uniref:PPE domain-containing protein n=1 Tax=Mycobacterium vicinigordonae TaxID=1719132 RepID=A0A7D6HWA8_9MYCO|nr:PPE domain-containing protein [Mycobacterium vicinigordonae]QLL05995.1 PPE domain-containing protein [Mycobacterium vicinigordonae]